MCTRSVPPYEIWAGNPARKIGQRFSDEVISDLLDLKWWDLPPAIIKEHLSLFDSELDVKKLETLKDIKNSIL